MRSTSPRLLFYSHNGVGVGHFRRQLRLATAVRARRPDAEILLVSGSHAAHTMADPFGFSVVNLPSIRMVDRYEHWEPHQPGASIGEVMRLRSDLLQQTVRRFRPDLLIADFMPAGPYGELVGALEELSSLGGRAVAGFRDIIDEPGFVRNLWRKTGVYDVLRRHYTAICVYGAAEVMDFVTAYDLSGELAGRLHYTGYLGAALHRSARLHPPSAPSILACTGGGVDGGELLEAFIRATRGITKELGARLAVGGPLLSEPELDRLRSLAGGSAVDVARFVPDLDQRIADSDLVVTMPGYNTSCELLSSRGRAIVVPRSGPSHEQRMRATWLESWGRARVVDPATLSPGNLRAAIRSAIDDPVAPTPPVSIDGMGRAVSLFEALAAGEPRAVAV